MSIPVKPNSEPNAKRGKHHPHRVQPNPFPDKFRLQNIAFKELPQTKGEGGDYYRNPIGPELVQVPHTTESRSPTIDPTKGMKEINPANRPDQQAEIDPDNREACRIEKSENEANRPLPSHKSGYGIIDVAKNRPDRCRGCLRGSQLSMRSTIWSQSYNR